ncbi:MAG TPA: GTP cyclohydrolase II [Anaerolineales bacterium]|jgi:GTP cyclohydrolase II|nr:GTP cyclohydrolase II [Anaerolineales bacterium]
MVDSIAFERAVSARLPTRYGDFQIHLYSNQLDEKEHLALVMGELPADEKTLVRVHSECLTGDVLGSRRCDCGEQLAQSLEMISKAGSGVLLYLRQEGRGIGLRDKLRAYNLQDEGLDTVDANLALGHQADNRDYDAAALILKDLGVAKVSLLTNNPNKIEELQRLGIEVVERIPLQGEVNPENARYLLTKAARMNHLLDLADKNPFSQNGAG